MMPPARTPLLLFFSLTAACSTTAAAQQWNDSRAVELATRATARRAQQIADPSLASYSAEASGIIVFQGKLGAGIPVPPVTVKHTQIRTKLFWTQPGRSKQVVVGLRDTSFFPENIGYYQDRYGIIQNNFPDVIRLGDGRDVSEVPHPLSPQGLLEYDFALRDSSSYFLSDRRIDIYVLSIRPKDAGKPRAIGALYIAQEDAAVVKMSFTFTRAAYLDKRNKDLTVTLENALIEGRFWLPRVQQLDLTRSAEPIEFPADALIRLRWEVCCYQVNVSVANVTFAGPEIISSPPSVLREYKWDTDIMASMPPDIRILTPQEMRAIRQQAEEVVQASALNRARGANLSANRASDFLRANRVEGLSAGAGARIRAGSGFSLSLRGRYGFSDEQPKGRVALSLDRVASPSFELYAERDYREAGVIQERSLATNTIAASAFGSDYTNLYDARSAGLIVDLSPLGAVKPTIELSYQTHAPLEVNFDPWSGSFAGVLPASRTNTLALGLSLSGTGIDGPFGFSSYGWSLSSEAAAFTDRSETFSLDGSNYFRLHGKFGAARPIGSSTLALSLFAGGIESSSTVPPQKLFFLGGPMSAPGYHFHELAGSMAATARAELQIPVPFLSISLGKYGRSPASATLAPYAGTSWISGPPTFSARSSGFYPSVGIGASFLFDLLRIDVSRGLRDGRLLFSADIMKELWGIL